MFFSYDNNSLKNKNKPLRVQSHTYYRLRKRTSQSASEEGSMTVEAAIIIPVFLCAFLGILLWAKVFLVHLEVETALLETARQIARQEALLTMQEKEGTGILSANILFSKNRKQGTEMNGLEVSSVSLLQSEYRKETREICLKASYTVKIPVLLLGKWRVPLNTSVIQKAWNGYTSEVDENGRQKEYVYITEHGTAYHKDSQCYHLHVTVREVTNVTDYYDGRTSLRPCEFCVSEEGRKSLLYICEDGECYHEDLSCGGLTRTVRYVEIGEVGGRSPCADCGNR